MTAAPVAQDVKVDTCVIVISGTRCKYFLFPNVGLGTLYGTVRIAVPHGSTYRSRGMT
eukprot:IDg6759t1